jgi:hypothetical protein
MFRKAIMVGAFAVAVAVAASDAAAAAAGRRALIITDGPGGCIELLSGSTEDGSRLVVGDCKDKTNGFGERAAGEGVVQLVSVKDGTMCMEPDSLREGAYVRLRKCCDGNRLQLFEWPRHIQAIDDPSLCVTYHGQHPDVGDYIKMKKCSRLQGDNWSHD